MRAESGKLEGDSRMSSTHDPCLELKHDENVGEGGL